MIINGFPDREIKVNTESYLYFGGTAYLGLPTNPEFKNSLTKSINKWGSFYGSSRNSNIKLSVYANVEKLFAEQIGSEDSVTVSSGTLAGKLVLEYLSHGENSFYHFPKTHPAILHKDSLPVFINGELHPNLKNDIEENIVITTDSILALEVEPTTFKFLENISSQKKMTLVVDESHSLGIIGNNGFGVYNSISKKNIKRMVMVSSLGKALGISGGLIASDTNLINSIKKEALFISSSCANPAYLETYLESQDLIALQQKKLQRNLDFLFNDLKLNATFKFNEKYPVIYCENEKIYNYLFENKIIITNFKYPNYNGLMSRIVMTANHTLNDLKNLKQLLISFG